MVITGNTTVGDIASAIPSSVRESGTREARDWTSEPLHVLIDHIVATYHEPLREELPRLESMAAKVSAVHGAKAIYLKRVLALIMDLSADLNLHMDKEERLLFPAFRAIESGARPGMAISAPIGVMEHEHDRAGGVLLQLRDITDGYAVPVWACQTFRALYHGLVELEAAMHLHVHLENNVLFPRALGAAGVK